MPEFVSIISAGPHCSLQDGGRVGHQAFGVPEGGAMDRDALILGNRLVGNPPDAAGLEICLGGLSFSPTIALRIALTGTAGDRLTITRTSGEILDVDAGISVVAEAGDIISTGFFRDTNCAFIAVGSQFDIGAPFGCNPPRPMQGWEGLTADFWQMVTGYRWVGQHRLPAPPDTDSHICAQNKLSYCAGASAKLV